MPVYSMTGYASASAGTGPDTGENTESTAVRAGTVTVELRSVNSRFLDLTLRLPDELRALEPGLREQLTQAFKRGKIELRLHGERADAEVRPPRPSSSSGLAGCSRRCWRRCRSPRR